MARSIEVQFDDEDRSEVMATSEKKIGLGKMGNSTVDWVHRALCTGHNPGI